MREESSHRALVAAGEEGLSEGKFSQHLLWTPSGALYAKAANSLRSKFIGRSAPPLQKYSRSHTEPPVEAQLAHDIFVLNAVWSEVTILGSHTSAALSVLSDSCVKAILAKGVKKQLRLNF